MKISGGKLWELKLNILNTFDFSTLTYVFFYKTYIVSLYSSKEKPEIMIKKILISTVVFASWLNGFACTNFLVGKSATTDGSTLITYSADSYFLFGALSYYPAATYPAGTMLDVHDWDTGKYLGKIKQAEKTYAVVGNMNELQVSIGETTYGGRPELVDTTAIMDYGSLIYIALQRARSAREIGRAHV